MFDRFTDRARKVMGYAREEAERLRHDHIGTEHILLGLFKEGSGVAVNVLENLDVEAEKVRAEVDRRVEPGQGEGPEQMPFTAAARKVLDHTMDEARALEHEYFGTEHILLGLLREEGCTAAEVLASLGVGLESVRREVVELLATEPGEAAPPVPAGPGPGEGGVPGSEFAEEAARLVDLMRDKRAAVVSQHFELAAELRDKVVKLRDEIAAQFLKGASPLAVRALACAAEEARREGSESIDIEHLRRGIERVEEEGREERGEGDG